MKLQLTILSVLSVSSLLTVSVFGQDAKPAPTVKAPATATVERIGEKIRAANGGSSQVTEIVKMSEAGVDEKTILGYIENLPAARIKADDVIYMHEKGISSAITSALLQHAATATATAQAQQAQVAAANAAAQAPAAQVAQPAQPTTPTPVYIESPQPVYVSPPPVVYTVPSYGYSYPYYYPRYSYPYYSRPSFSIGFSTRFPFPHHFPHHGFSHHGFHHRW